MTAKQPCRNLILMVLLPDKRLGFEEIVREVDYSRGTVNNHLRNLYKEKLVKQESCRGSRKYYLSKLGKTWAGKISFYRVVYKVVDPEENAAEIKSALEDLQRLISLALSKYDNDLDAFFSCYAELFETPITGVYKYTKPKK